MRADDFVQTNINYLQGMLIDAFIKLQKRENTNMNKNILKASVNEIIEESLNSGTVLEENIDNLNDNLPLSSKMKIGECPTCASGLPVETNHQCIICKKSVHNLDVCSVPITEEGYNQKRCCLRCFQFKEMDYMETVPISTETSILEHENPRGEENWRNKNPVIKKGSIRNISSIKKKRSIYLHPHKSFGVLNDKEKIPRLDFSENKTIDERVHFFINMDLYNSILQALTAGYVQNKKNYKNLMNLKPRLNWVQQISHLANNNTELFIERRERFMIKYFDKNTPVENDILTIDCSSTIEQILMKFKNFTTYEEFESCTSCQYEKENKFRVISLSFDIENNIVDLQNNLNKKLSRKLNNCNLCKEGTVITEIHLKDVIVLLVYPTTKNVYKDIKLDTNCIPKLLKFENNENNKATYIIASFIKFDRSKSPSEFGFFTSLYFNEINEMYTQIGSKSDTLQNNIQNVQCIIYSRN